MKIHVNDTKAETPTKEQKDRYLKNRIKKWKKIREAAGLVKCACGCGELIYRYSKWGDPVRVKNGHGAKGLNRTRIRRE